MLPTLSLRWVALLLAASTCTEALRLHNHKIQKKDKQISQGKFAFLRFPYCVLTF